MKTFKKFVAMTMAVSALTASISGVATNAEEMERSLSLTNENVTAIMQEADALFDSGEITFDQAIQLKTMLSSSSESENYPHYDDLCTDDYAATDNHIAIVANPTGNGFSVGNNCYVEMYVNKNILTTGLLASQFSSGAATVKKVKDLGGSANSRHYCIYFDVVSAIPAGAVLFTFNFPTSVYNNTNISSEYSLHLATVRNTGNPVFVLDASDALNNSSVVYKCHYALGDVNHDASVDEDDKVLIMKYIVGLLTLPTSRPELDRISFKQAADVNQDGVINILDAISIS